MGLRDRLKGPPPGPSGQSPALPARPPASGDVTLTHAHAPQWSGISADIYQNLKHELHQKLIEKLDLRTIEKLPRDQLREELRAILSNLLQGTELPLNRTERESMVEELLDEVTGLGPLEPLLADTTISDIMVNGFNICYIERFGKLELTQVRFRDNAHLQQIIVRIVTRVGRGSRPRSSVAALSSSIRKGRSGTSSSSVRSARGVSIGSFAISGCPRFGSAQTDATACVATCIVSRTNSGVKSNSRLRGFPVADAIVSSRGHTGPPLGENRMLVSHAQPMPSVSPPGALLNALWPRASAMAIAAAEGLLQARCGLGGHTMAMRFEKTRVSLQCLSCGHNTPGWTIHAQSQIFTETLQMAR
jgi:hypothetical protein